MVKIIKLCPDVSLNVLLVHTPFVVVGAADGAVRFYDYQFRVQAWFEDLSAGAVKSISFELSSDDRDADEYAQAPGQATAGNDDEFKCPAFLVSTGSALVVLA